MRVKSIVEGGSLFPDEITIEVVKKRLAEPDCAINLDVDEITIVSRLSSCRFCPDCNGIFNDSCLKVRTVDGNGGIDVVYGRILTALKQ